MTDGLLTEILATERDIRSRISELEAGLKESLAALAVQLEKERQEEMARCEAQCSMTVEEVREAARREASALLDAAAAYADWINGLSDEELKRIISRHLGGICTESGHDRHDEQA